MVGHTPVLTNEVIQFLDPKPGARFIDATFGAGGHSRAILERTAPDGMVLGIDQDESALSRAASDFASFGSRIIFAHSNFSDIAELATRKRIQSHRSPAASSQDFRGLYSS